MNTKAIVSKKSSEEIIADLQSGNISPLALPAYIAECEFYDTEDARNILDKVLKDINNDNKDTLVMPILTVLVDTPMKVLGFSQKKIEEFGLLPSKLLIEIKNFRYETDDTVGHSPSCRPEPDEQYDREKYEDKSKLKKFKRTEFKNRKCGKDGYTGERIYRDQATAPNFKKSAEVDHIISLKQSHDQFKVVGSLTDEQKKELANSPANLTMTSRKVNNTKRADTIIDVCSNDKLTPKEKECIIKKQVESHLKTSYAATGMASQNLTKQHLGELAAAVIVPFGYEIRDIFVNGLTFATEGHNAFSAMKYRMKRIFNYIIKRLPAILKDIFKDVTNAIIDIVSALVASIVKKFIRYAFEAIRIVTDAFKVMLSGGSPAQKADAFFKIIISGLVPLFIGVGLESLLGGFLPSPFSDILTIAITGIVTVIILHFVDKIDLFNAKEQIRRQRIKEIFDARIAQIKKDTSAFDISVTKKMEAVRIKFEENKILFNNAIAQNDFVTIDKCTSELASMFHVKIPYANSKEFVKYIKSEEKILIGL